MANTRRHRRASRRANRKSRRNTRRASRRSSRRSSRRNNMSANMMGGRRRSRRGVAGTIYGPVGALARGTGRTVGTAARAGIKLFENLVSGANKTVRSAASTINSTVGKIIPKGKHSRKHRGGRRRHH